MTQEQQAPQIPVTDEDFAELFRRMPVAYKEITIIVQERTLREQQAKIEELESKNSEFVLDEFKRKDDEKKVKAV
jgi:tetrahydromethanopterin S-methyltransferase subunit G